MKSISKIQLRTRMRASAMRPIIEVAVKAALISQWPRATPISVNGAGIRIRLDARHGPPGDPFAGLAMSLVTGSLPPQSRR
jgi:hypothetical protein